MSSFAIGILLIAIALTGNAGNFGRFAIKNSYSFVKWFIAVWILDWCFTKAPPNIRPATRIFSGGLVAGIVLINQNKIVALIKQAGSEFSSGALSASNRAPDNDTGLNSNATWSNNNMATLQQQQSFIQQNLPYATQVANALGTTPATVLAQSAYETGWGTSSVYNQYNNVAGINNPGSQTGEDYAQYNSLAAGWQGYQNLMQEPRYQYTYGLTGTMFAQAANDAGYSTNPNYASEYGGVYNSVLNLMGVSS